MPLIFLILVLTIAQANDDIGNVAHQKYSSKNAIESNMFQPMQNENSQLATVDGSTEFDSQISCSASDSAVKVQYSRYASGDYKIDISHDQNLDGTYDYTFSTSSIGVVSGICGDGLVFCGSGSYNNCEKYKWGFSNNKIRLYRSEDVVSCFCANNSCGGVFDSNVYETVGGAIAATLSVDNFMYSGSRFDDSTNTYYISGQATEESCNTSNTPYYDNYGSSSPTEHYGSNYPSTTITDIEVEQGNDEDSLYSTLSPRHNDTVEDGSVNGMDLSTENAGSTFESTTKSDGTIYYTDLQNQSKDVTVPDGGNCPVKRCSVSIVGQDTSEFDDGTNRSSTSSAVNETIYKECINDSCPLESGETLIEDCSCQQGMDGFSKAAAALGAIEEAAKDMVCSTN